MTSHIGIEQATAAADDRPPTRARLLILLLSVFAWASFGPHAYARTAPDSFADLAQRLLPAVVNISTAQTIPAHASNGDRSGPEVPQFPPGSPFEDFFRDFFDRQHQGQDNALPRHAVSLGSGFVIDAAQGLVVTNNHVIADSDDITVTLQDDTNLKADVVGRDTKTDIALLHVKTDHPLTAVKFGNSDDVRVGDWVLAIGNPFGLGGTVTAGILSARAREINQGPYDDFLQSDASINKGNSGGPMFNMAGDVIGINTAIFSPTGGSVGIGFAIPASLAKGVVDQLRQFGHTKRGWLGVRIQAVTPEIADSLGLDKPHGALVASTTPGGPAADAGIEAGDVVLSFDGKTIDEMRKLPRTVAETAVGKVVPVSVWRKNQALTKDVKVGELEKAEESGMLASTGGDEPKDQATDSAEALGLKLTGITAELRQQFDLGDEQKGVLITEVKGNTPAADKGLRPGDVIVEVGQEEVSAPADVVAKIKAAQTAGRKSVLLLVDRQGDLRFVALGTGQG